MEIRNGKQWEGGEHCSQPIEGIKCQVKNCVYHSPQSSCCAGKIEVGPSHASDSTETICATFKPMS